MGKEELHHPSPDSTQLATCCKDCPMEAVISCICLHFGEDNSTIPTRFGMWTQHLVNWTSKQGMSASISDNFLFLSDSNVISKFQLSKTNSLYSSVFCT